MYCLIRESNTYNWKVKPHLTNQTPETQTCDDNDLSSSGEPGHVTSSDHRKTFVTDWIQALARRYDAVPRRLQSQTLTLMRQQLTTRQHPHTIVIQVHILRCQSLYTGNLSPTHCHLFKGSGTTTKSSSSANSRNSVDLPAKNPRNGADNHTPFYRYCLPAAMFPSTLSRIGPEVVKPTPPRLEVIICFLLGYSRHVHLLFRFAGLNRAPNNGENKVGYTERNTHTT